MSTESPGSERSDPTVLINLPAELEDAILSIYEETEPGSERTARVEALCEAHPEHQKSIRMYFVTADLLGGESADSGLTSASRFGPYQLIERIGEGSMGVVFRAQDPALARQVALKVLPPHCISDSVRRSRFEQEAQAAASLRHENIVAIFDSGEVEGVPYFTMEFIEGRSLGTVIDHLCELDRAVGQLRASDLRAAVGAGVDGSTPDRFGRTYLEAVCHITIDIAEALAHAHEHGVIHRDVKPSNIVIRPSGQALLCDFGLARHVDRDRLTRSGDVLGTPLYMSPEQVKRGGTVDHRSDLYSLGVTLFQLLTLDVPFDRIPDITTKEPPRPRRAHPLLPLDLETVCLTAIEKSPDQRYQSGTELAEDLRRFLRYEPVRVQAIGRLTRSLRWVKRNPAKAALGVLLPVALIAAVVIPWLWFLLSLADEQLTEVQAQIVEAEQLRDDTVAELAARREELTAAQDKLEATEGQLAAAEGQLDESQRQLGITTTQLEATQGQLSGTVATLETTQAALGDTKRELGDAKTDLLQTRSRVRKLTTDVATLQGDVSGLERERDELLALRDGLEAHNQLIAARQLVSSDPARGLAAALDASTRLEPSAEQRTIVLELRVANAERRTLAPTDGTVDAAALSRGGERAVTGELSGRVTLWDTVLGTPLDSIALQSPVVHVGMLDSGAVVAATRGGAVHLWRPGEEARALPGISWSTEFGRLVSLTGEHVVARHATRPHLVAVLDGTGLSRGAWLEQSQGAAVRSARFAANGQRLALGSARTVEVWDLAAAAPEVVARIELDRDVLSAALDADGRRAAVVDSFGRVSIWRDGDHEHDLELTRKLSSAASIRFAAGDSRLVVSVAGETFVLIVSEDDELVARARWPNAGEGGVWLEPKGHVLYEVDRAGRFVCRDAHSGQTIAIVPSGDVAFARSAASFAVDGHGGVIGAAGLGFARIWSLTPPGGVPSLGVHRIRGHDLREFADAAFSGGSVIEITDGFDQTWEWTIGEQVSRRRSEGVAMVDGVEPQFEYRWDDARRAAIVARGRLDDDVEWIDRPRELWVGTAGDLTKRRGLPPGDAGGGQPIFDPTGERLLIGAMQLNSVPLDGSEWWPLVGSERPAAFSSDGTRVAASTGFGLAMWSVTDRVRRDLVETDEAWAADVTFSPDGRFVASGWSDGRVRVHAVEDGRLCSAVAAHVRAVQSIAWRGSDLVSGGEDGFVRAWRVGPAGELERWLEFDAHRPVRRVALGIERRVVAVTAERVWVLPLE